MNLDFKTCEMLINRLKASQKFRIVEDDKPHGFGDGADYRSYTILEGETLEVVYARYNLLGWSNQNDISIVDKEKNICIYSNSLYPGESGIGKMERMDMKTLDEPIVCLSSKLQMPYSI